MGDQPDLVETQKLIRSLLRKAKTLAVLYNAGEANSVKTLAELKKVLDASFTLVEKSVLKVSGEFKKI